MKFCDSMFRVHQPFPLKLFSGCESILFWMKKSFCFLPKDCDLLRSDFLSGYDEVIASSWEAMWCKLRSDAFNFSSFFSKSVWSHSRTQSLRSFWPGAGIALWEQPFQACAKDADCVRLDGQNSVILFVISKWLLTEPRFLPQARRIVGSEDENGLKRETNWIHAYSANQHQVIKPSRLPKVSSWLKQCSLSQSIRSADHLNGIFDNSGENSNRWVAQPSGIFSEKGYTFRGITFFSLLPELPETDVLFVYTYQCQALYGNTSEKECQRPERWRKISKTFTDAMGVFSHR